MAKQKVKRLTNGTGSGFTFIEVLVAVLVLGILLAGLTPQLSAGNAEKLDLAASEVLAAVRFARSEAMRTGEVHAILVDETTSQITVEKTDLTTNPASAESVLYHPINRQPYTFNVASSAVTRNVSIDSSRIAFVYLFYGSRQRLMFDAAGLPVYIDTASGNTYQLFDGRIKLEYGELERRVVVQPYIGRVSVQ
jgi:prepilin-type N-terminal cleavage/methylation domain-containing protein